MSSNSCSDEEVESEHSVFENKQSQITTADSNPANKTVQQRLCEDDEEEGSESEETEEEIISEHSNHDEINEFMLKPE